MISVQLERPWLAATLPAPMRVLSWAPHRAGFVTADRIVWREVRNADLVPGFDAEVWLAVALRERGWGQAVGMMTSRDVGTYRMHAVEVEGVRAACLATVGLSNAESVGRRQVWKASAFGTINLAVAVDAGLTEVAQLEALSIAVEARTAAVIEAGWQVPTGRATGTGTDCAALACHAGSARYAGLHTAVGEAVGAAVRGAVEAGVADWLAWRASRA